MFVHKNYCERRKSITTLLTSEHSTENLRSKDTFIYGNKELTSWSNGQLFAISGPWGCNGAFADVPPSDVVRQQPRDFAQFRKGRRFRRFRKPSKPSTKGRWGHLVHQHTFQSRLENTTKIKIVITLSKTRYYTPVATLPLRKKS